MLPSFFNPGMLIGLIGIGLPLLVHILSRRHVNTISWGAMQFLQRAPRTRRLHRLEQVLLLLLRMAIIATLVIAFARPWVLTRHSLLASGRAASDVVLIVDGSLSMQATSDNVSLHRRAIERAQLLLASLSTDDAFSLIDARDLPAPVMDRLTQDKLVASQKLDDLPLPSGSLNVLSAFQHAVSILARGQHQRQQIILFTDGQAHGWSTGSMADWQQFQATCAEWNFQPEISIIDVGELPEVNFGIGPLVVSEEQTVVGRPLKLRAEVQAFGNPQPVSLTAQLLVNDVPVGSPQQVTIPADGQVSVVLEHRFETAGEKVVSLQLGDVISVGDELKGDDVCRAVVDVAEALKVLLVNGTPSADDVKRETYFLETALGRQDDADSWIDVTTVDWDRWEQESIADYDLIVLANVPQFSETGIKHLTQFVNQGGGLLWALGDQVQADDHNRHLFSRDQGPLPVKLEQIETAAGEWATGLRISPKDEGDPSPQNLIPTSTSARFQKWWSFPESAAAALETWVRFENGSPYLLGKSIGNGRSFVLTAPLDADWGNLPARPEWVPFVYELLFRLRGESGSRNLKVGQPMVAEGLSPVTTRQVTFIDPEEELLGHRLNETGFDRQLISAPTHLSGLYRLKSSATGDGPSGKFLAHFAVEFDRGETDLTSLTATQKDQLQTAAGLQFMSAEATSTESATRSETKAELWPYFLLLALLLYVAESALTRWLVRTGYATSDSVSA